MIAYLCANLCSVIGVQGNTKNNKVTVNWRFYAKKLEKCLEINPWVNKEQQRNP
jgi:hypothetical protein